MTVENGEFMRVSCRVTSSSGDQVNVFHGRTSLDAAMSDDDFLSAVVTGISTLYNGLSPYIASEINPADIRVDQVGWLGSPPEEYIIRNVGTRTWVGPFDPAGTGDFLPPGVAANIKFRTGAVKALGRKFLFTMTEAARNGGGWTGPFYTALATFGAAVVTGTSLGAGKSIDWGVWAKRANAWVDFISYVVDTRAAYQRRRKEFVGS